MYARRRRPTLSHPIVVVRVDERGDRRSFERTFAEAIEFILAESARDESTDEFLSTTVLMDTSKLSIIAVMAIDGRATELAGQFLQVLEDLKIRRGLGISAELHRIRRLRRMMDRDLSDPNAMRVWSGMRPDCMARNRAEHFMDVVARVETVIEETEDRDSPSVLFTHEGVAPAVAFALLREKLPEIPPDIPPGGALAIAGRNILRLPEPKSRRSR